MAERFIVGDNDDRHITKDNEVKIERKINDTNNALVWTMSYEDLIDLQTTIRTYLADG